MPGVALTHPIDTIKLRLQLQGNLAANEIPKYRGTFSGIATIAREEGIHRLFAGVSPALFRAFVFGAARIGSYAPIRNYLAHWKGSDDPTFFMKVVSATASGTFGKCRS